VKAIDGSGSTVPAAGQELSIGELAARSGFAASALRYYEREGILHARRGNGNQRRFDRNQLRRLAFVRAARTVGLSLEEIRALLDTLPQHRAPTRADWTRISRSWRARLEAEIEALVALRDGLDSCIGCGCLSLQRCRLSNPRDAAAQAGPGAVFLPRGVRATGDEGSPGHGPQAAG
jgi:MerR family transcriptional regulator, redox-sensitive transcriptional activator SoxR